MEGKAAHKSVSAAWQLMMQLLDLVTLHKQHNLVSCFITSITYTQKHIPTTRYTTGKHSETLLLRVSLAALSASVTVVLLHFTEPIQVH